MCVKRHVTLQALHDKSSPCQVWWSQAFVAKEIFLVDHVILQVHVN